MRIYMYRFCLSFSDNSWLNIAVCAPSREVADRIASASDHRLNEILSDPKVADDAEVRLEVADFAIQEGVLFKIVENNG